MHGAHEVANVERDAVEDAEAAGAEECRRVQSRTRRAHEVANERSPRKDMEMTPTMARKSL
eukprot:7897882-Alexandrium_andersonii.AAC.1